ncbi:hypothetical protein H2200_004573 [Cladophialophora chaetospira]|uniref:NACHT domain-containing protein n=1 Tax=Cladophialophora chaetospira TaxID=386627 RepID=A0AA39CKK6_9EURO|nr:hypothetical protein H2200_004573 [Cladophialophora chaetospira]
MVLDPLSALAVGASVVQFLKFSGKLISKATELYKGSSKSLIEVQELHDVSQRLVQLNSDLLATRGRLRSKVKQKTLPPSEQALEHVSLECTQIATEFEGTLQKLLASTQKDAWKSCRQAFKSIWNKDGLEAIQRRLGQQREQLVIHLLVVISNNQLESLGEFRNENSRLESHILDAVRASHTELKRDLAGFAANLGHPGKQNVSNIVEQNWRGWQEAHKNDLRSAFDDFSLRISSEKEQQIRDYILSTLHSPQSHDRELRIRAAHTKTFGWIFESSSRHKPFSDFVKWANMPSTSGQIYWVAGKPGSGKSTLMRFLTQDDRTKALLTTSSSTKPLLFASWFFWLAGTDVQKSYRGMIRSLLDDRKLPDWTIAEIEDAFNTLLRTTADSYRLALFIDGLDELQGAFQDHSMLVESMRRISQFAHVKLCVSSRPWPVFKSALSKGPMLRLECLTHGDISRYVHDKFYESHEFQSLWNAEPDLCSALVREVVDKAQGVFLWVYLVVQSLLQGLIEGDMLDELYLRLRKMPEDLDDFFRYIVMGIQHDYRPEAAALFKVVLDVESPTVSSLSFLNQALKDSDFWRATEESIWQPLTLQISTMTRRIESRGKGLLEVVNEGGNVHAVSFLHRTARDFLLAPSSQDVLGDYYPKDFSPNLFTCRAIVAQLKLWGSTMPLKLLGVLRTTFLESFRKYETESKNTDVQLMDHFTIIVNKEMDEHGRALIQGEYDPRGSSVFLALVGEIKLYALYKIEHGTFDLDAVYFHCFDIYTPSCLLRLCICQPVALFEVAAALIKRGAKIDHSWTEFLIKATGEYDRRQRESKALDPARSQMAKLLIQLGPPVKVHYHPERSGLYDCRPVMKKLFPTESDQFIALLNKRQQSKLQRLSSVFKKKTT